MFKSFLSSARGRLFGRRAPDTGILSSIQTLRYNNVVRPPFGFSFGGDFWTAPVNRLDTAFYNLRTFLITNTWVDLAYLYATCGIVRTFIDVVVDDAFSKGFELSIPDLGSEDLKLLESWMEDHRVTHCLKTAFKWCRLYGGAGIIINTQDGREAEEFFPSQVDRNSSISFIPCSMWELFQGANGYDDLPKLDAKYNYYQSVNFNYNNVKLNHSRVITLVGREAPDVVRNRLRGWGLSEVEAIISALNRYLKSISVSFELLDECKLDVYKVRFLNDAILAPDGVDRIRSRFGAANAFKNYHNAILIDSEDEFQQKTLNFAGLSEIMREIRRQLSSELNIPENRLFGISSTGFASGNDSQENYQTFVQGHVQEPAKAYLKRLITIGCRNLFEFTPRSIEVTFPSIRSLTSSEEEDVKSKKLDRIIRLVDAGLLSQDQARSAINREKLLPIKLGDGDSDDPFPPEEPEPEDDYENPYDGAE